MRTREDLLEEISTLEVKVDDLTGELKNANEELKDLKAILSNPVAVWVNILRGTIAYPLHLQRLEKDLCEHRAKLEATEKQLAESQAEFEKVRQVAKELYDLLCSFGLDVEMMENDGRRGRFYKALASAKEIGL